MYDRKKITLFVLLIATVLLGGISLYLAVRVNQNTAPDDSQAGAGICKGIQSANDEVCGPKSQASCNGVCVWIPASTSTCTAPGGVVISEGGEACVGNNKYRCQQGGQNATLFACCNNYVFASGTCTAPNTSICTVPIPGDVTLDEGAEACFGNDKYRCQQGGQNATLFACCNNYVFSNGKCNAPGGSGTGGSSNCTQGGQTIAHGATSCIGGSNYSCNNGTVTQGGACGGDPDPDPTTGGSTSSCSVKAPTKALQTSPENDAVFNTSTVTLTWNKNGSWGTSCDGVKNNTYRVRLAIVDAGAACPTDRSNTGGFYDRVGIVDGDTPGTFTLNVADGMKYCWIIRKHNGDEAADSGLRSFTVDLTTVVPTSGGGGEEATVSTTGDIDESTSGTTGGTLPTTAIISDELDPILFGMVLVIVGLTLYKFDFGRRKEIEV